MAIGTDYERLSTQMESDPVMTKALGGFTSKAALVG